MMLIMGNEFLDIEKNSLTTELLILLSLEKCLMWDSNLCD